MYNDPVVKRGFARGTEPVAYVDQILSRWENDKEFVLAPDLNENKSMTRGWESKGVESQIEDREARRNQPAADRQSIEHRERDQKRAGLETSKRRITRELASSRSESHRAALQNALAFLDGELKKLD